MTPATDILPTVETPRAVRGTLRALARRDLAVKWFAGLGRILALFLGFGVVRCFLDFWVQLDWSVRAAFLGIDFILIGWIAWRYLWQPWRVRLGIETAALRLERVFPVLGSRAIAAVQLPGQVAREGVSRELVEVVVHDAASVLSTLRWRAAAPARPALRWLALALACALVGAAGFALQPKVAPVLARRWLLSHELPVTRTKLVLAQHDLQVAHGNPVTLGATATGDIPKQAVFEVKPATGDTRGFPIAADAARPGAFTLKIDNVQQSFRYRVRAGDARSEWYDVTVLPSPAVLAVKFTIQPPAYTRLPAATSTGDALVVPAGSTVTIKGRASLPLTTAQVALWNDGDAKDGKPAVTAALALDADPSAFSGSIVVNAPATALTLPLKAVNGLASENDTHIPLRFVPDAPPVITIAFAPKDGELATRDSLFSVRGRAIDDYGLTHVAFCWKITRKDSTDIAASGRTELTLPPDAGRGMDFFVPVAIGTPVATRPGAIPLTAAPGDDIYWWIEATDNNPAPSVTASPHRVVHVVTPDQKLAEMMGQLRDGLNELDDVSHRQEQISDSLSRLLPPALPQQGNPKP